MFGHSSPAKFHTTTHLEHDATIPPYSHTLITVSAATTVPPLCHRTTVMQLHSVSFPPCTWSPSLFTVTSPSERATVPSCRHVTMHLPFLTSVVPYDHPRGTPTHLSHHTHIYHSMTPCLRAIVPPPCRHHATVQR